MPFVFTSLAGEVAETAAGWMAGRLVDAATEDGTARPAPPVVPPGMSGPPAAGGGVLRLEPDQIDGAIAVFQAALDKLERRVFSAGHALRPGPTADDQVSRDASVVFGRAADPRSRRVEWCGWRDPVGDRAARRGQARAPGGGCSRAGPVL